MGLRVQGYVSGAFICYSIWLSIFTVYGEVKGTGSAKTKTEAKEIAATRALNWFKNSE